MGQETGGMIKDVKRQGQETSGQGARYKGQETRDKNRKTSIFVTVVFAGIFLVA